MPPVVELTETTTTEMQADWSKVPGPVDYYVYQLQDDATGDVVDEVNSNS